MNPPMLGGFLPLMLPLSSWQSLSYSDASEKAASPSVESKLDALDSFHVIWTAFVTKQKSLCLWDWFLVVSCLHFVFPRFYLSAERHPVVHIYPFWLKAIRFCKFSRRISLLC